MEWITTPNEQDHSIPARLLKIGHGRPLAQQILSLLVFGLAWYMLIAHLSPHWATNSQYTFGWLVPFLCAYLFLLRWRTRPPARIARLAVASRAFWGIGFCLLPTWLIAQANPDWRLIGWILAVEIVALSLCTIYILGGSSWLGHFAFSICFILVSVPWLSAVEKSVIDGLTQAATVVAVASLNLFHIAAVQHGNVIEVKTGMLGVDEACSGIRSLQATMVVSLFFGEVYRASALRRVALIFGGALIAFLCNVGRFFVLGAVAAKDGLESISIWHDPLGAAVLAVCLLLVWALARLLSGSPQKFSRSKEAPATTFPWRLTSGLGLWILLTLVGTEFWYRIHETPAKAQWSVQWPAHEKDFSDVNLSDLEASLLGCDSETAAQWTSGDGSRWTAFFFKWAKGPARSRILAGMHRPETCLPAAGYQLRQDRGTFTVQANGLMIPFHALTFEDAGQQVYVYHCLWEDRSKPSAGFSTGDVWNRFARLELVLRGERNLGQQVLEIVITGYHTPEEAETAFRQHVEAMIQT
jgi:exosortase